MAQNYFTKLNFHELAVVGSSGGAKFNYYKYSLNNVFDPNITVAGGHCSGFDKLAEMYCRYQVVAAKFRLCCVSIGANSMYCGYHLANQQEVAPATWREAVDTLTELPRSKWGMLGSNTTADHTRKWFKGYVSFKKQFPQQYRDRDCGALVDASPTKQYVLELIQADNDDTTVDLTYHCFVTITYYVRFSEPKFTTY